MKLLDKVRRLPSKPGVYLMKDRLGTILYVGKAKDLKKRVLTYFQARNRLWTQQPKVAAMLPLIFDVEVAVVRSEAEALLLEGQLIKKWKPRYNTDFVDDKQFPLIMVDMRQTLPRFRLVRSKSDSSCRYYGPYIHGGMVRRILSALRKKFGILLADAQPKLCEDGRYCLYDDARSSLYGNDNHVSLEHYKERVAAACAFLDGRDQERLNELKAAMQAASDARQYEKAAHFRDHIQALEESLNPPELQVLAPARAPLLALERLQAHLGLECLPERIECFDISHISGTFVVASMVHFFRGLPAPKSYRRFRIRSFIGNDDYRAMEEVVGRRYTRLQAEHKRLPDLVVVDGGQGQVHAAFKALTSLKLPAIPLIGLAKRQECLYFPDDRPALQLPLEDLGLQLLQRLRDEAHRFANTYSAQLRSKKINESFLDTFSGLGPARKAALLAHFKGLKALKNADEQALAAVPGIGVKRAKELYTFLNESRS